MGEPPLLQLAIWLAGTIPATFIAAKREPAWRARDINTEAAVPLAIMFWPGWLMMFALSPVVWIVGKLYGAIYAAAAPTSPDPEAPGE